MNSGADDRAIGGDRIAHAATRNMACCAVTGQAAGIAAALSVRTGQPLHELDAASSRPNWTSRESVTSKA